MIQPKYQTLNELFSDRVFRIPRYQRFYSWETKQREDLFSDIRELAEKGEDRHHFMATIVCFRTGDVTSVRSRDYRTLLSRGQRQRGRTFPTKFQPFVASCMVVQ